MNQNDEKGLENGIKLITSDQLNTLPISIREWVMHQKVHSGLHKIQMEDEEYTLISLGMRPNPGYQLQVTNIVQQDNQVKVEVTEHEPTPGTFYPQMIVYPFVLTKSDVPINVEGLNHVHTKNPQSK
ncbi:PrcB C-terminal [Thermoactinomyces sp. DSM 45891]|uniref:protease complex subunit PrcB family protein n=1 Tax=Thermoactinomyces sp. DSM 45891 TaxID=1761907 RepID=UPI000913948B|nr:protease complex subunit PrcB family protein [Thermoactinomyces sp. DSM 45891]SFX06790.1 PrcB C-terminal [Thermoactinomyces sp. DSM 45891]